MSKKHKVSAEYILSNFGTVRVVFTLRVPNNVPTTFDKMVKTSELLGELGKLLNCDPMCQMTIIHEPQEDSQPKLAFSVQGVGSVTEA